MQISFINLGPATQVTLIPWQLILWISWISWIALPGMTISGRFWPSFAPRDTGSYLHDFPARSLPARPITSQDASRCLDRCSLSDLGLIVYKNGWRSEVTWGMHFSKHQTMEASIRSGCKISSQAANSLERWSDCETSAPCRCDINPCLTKSSCKCKGQCEKKGSDPLLSGTNKTPKNLTPFKEDHHRQLDP